MKGHSRHNNSIYYAFTTFSEQPTAELSAKWTKSKNICTNVSQILLCSCQLSHLLQITLAQFAHNSRSNSISVHVDCRADSRSSDVILVFKKMQTSLSRKKSTGKMRMKRLEGRPMAMSTIIIVTIPARFESIIFKIHSYWMFMTQYLPAWGIPAAPMLASVAVKLQGIGLWR